MWDIKTMRLTNIFHLYLAPWLCGVVLVSASGATYTIEDDPVREFRHLLPDVNLENNTVIDVTVHVGASAFLPCRFRTLADHQVSWFRRRDWHILTTGTFTYTNDERFSVLHPDGSLDWTLQIKYITRRDNGTYECQLSTGTGVLSHFVNLHVAVPRASILVRGDYHVQAGSTITLVCVVEQSPEPPQFIFWYHNDKMINYDTERGGVKVAMTTGGPTGDTRSQLTISNAQQEDTGNYTCSASNTRPASTSVFVTYGDSLPAIQRRDESSSATTHSSSSLPVSSPILSHFLLLPFLLLSYLISLYHNLYLFHSHVFQSHQRTQQTSPAVSRVR